MLIGVSENWTVKAGCPPPLSTTGYIPKGPVNPASSRFITIPASSALGDQISPIVSNGQGGWGALSAMFEGNPGEVSPCWREA